MKPSYELNEVDFYFKKLKLFAASNGEPIRHLAESSAKPMRSRGFNHQFESSGSVIMLTYIVVQYIIAAGYIYQFNGVKY
jgi:hypothetical protein